MNLHHRSSRPTFIAPEVFRAYLGRAELNRLMQVDGIMATSFISRCSTAGRPIRTHECFGQKWRPMDVITRARADGVQITKPPQEVLDSEIAELQKERDALRLHIDGIKHSLSIQNASSRLTGRTMLTEREIVEGGHEIPNLSGIYFLLRGGRVVYIGQSVNVFNRISTGHREKKFDGYAWVPCPVAALDVLESLYIHALQPPLNGIAHDGRTPVAPLRLDQLLARIDTTQVRRRTIHG